MIGHRKFIEWFVGNDDEPEPVRVLLWESSTGRIYQMAHGATLKNPTVFAYPTKMRNGRLVKTSTRIRLTSADLVPVSEGEAVQYARVEQVETEHVRGAAAFTLVELLVVVGIIAIILTVIAPALTRMVQSANVEAARSSIPAAAATARAYCSVGGSFPVGQYRGSAVVVTPWGELRITRHTYRQFDPDGDPFPTELMDFDDVPGEPYVSLPSTVGVVGLSRLDDGAPMLLPPPFAIRFTREGTMRNYHYTPGGPFDDEGEVVFYSDDYSPRPSDYDPAEYDPDVVGRTPQNWDDAAEEWIMPFGMLESVVGVVVYNKAELRSAGHSLEGGTTGVGDDARDWIMENGKPLFFNQYSGSGIKP